jgi:membrane-bound lytic murein transglycosylase F
MGIKDRLDPKENIRAGTKYLKILYDAFYDIKDSVQRVKFTLAAYNCGYFHVKDAQKLAAMNHLDPNVWDGQVDQMILALTYPQNYNKEEVEYGYVRGQEPYDYVIDIFKRYDHYLRFIDE